MYNKLTEKLIINPEFMESMHQDIVNMSGHQLQTLYTTFIRNSLFDSSVHSMNEDNYYPLYDDLNEQTTELVGCKRVVGFAHTRYASKESRFAHIVIEKEDGIQHLMQYRILDDQAGYSS